MYFKIEITIYASSLDGFYVIFEKEIFLSKILKNILNNILRFSFTVKEDSNL